MTLQNMQVVYIQNIRDISDQNHFQINLIIQKNSKKTQKMLF